MRDTYSQSYIDAVAKSLVPEEDAPYEKLNDEQRSRLNDEARAVLAHLNALGFRLVRDRIIRD